MAVMKVAQSSTVKTEDIFINRFEDDIWLFKEPYEDLFYKCNLKIEGVNKHWMIKFKEFVLYKFNGFVGKEGYISATAQQSYTVKADAKTFLLWATQNHPKCDLADFTLQHVIDFTNASLKRGIKGTTFETTLIYIRQSYWGYMQKKLSDGLIFRVPSVKHAKPHSIYHQACEAQGIDFNKWVKPEPHGSIPVAIAITLLSHCIEVIRSDHYKCLTSYQLLISKLTTSAPKGMKEKTAFNTLSKLPSFYLNGEGDFYLYCNPKTTNSLATKLRNIYVNCINAELEFNVNEYWGKNKLYQDSINIKRVLVNNQDKWEWYNHAEKEFGAFVSQYNISNQQIDVLSKGIKSVCNNYIGKELNPAVFIILLSLSGARSMSEILQMKYRDVVRDNINPDRIIYTTPIEKTNHGIIEKRTASLLFAEAVNCLIEIKQDVIDNFVFSSLMSRTPKVSEETLRSNLKAFYDRFGEKYPELYALHPHIKPHQFRHTWAEFSLRMFEGENLPEEIRQHFMHSYSSYMTDTYRFNKLKPEVTDELVKSYIKEILSKIVSEELQGQTKSEYIKDIQGEAIAYIIKGMSDFVATPDDIESYVDELADEYVHIKAHEYGYCLSRKDLIKHANCYNKEDEIPSYDESKYTTCIGCRNFCSSKQNSESAIIRQAISHKEFAKSRMEMFGVNEDDKIVAVSLKAEKEGRDLLNKWKAS